MTAQSHNPEFPKDSVLSKPRRKPTGVYRKLRRKLAATGLRKPLLWLRHRGFRPEDIFLGSYPRSGTTWSRFVIFEILTGSEGGFDEVNGTLHGVGNAATGAKLLPGGGRFLATHERYHQEYHKAIYLVRDVRNVILSEFAYTTALEFFHGDLDKFIDTFLRKKVNPFGPWQEHVASWLDSPIADTPNLLLVHFEDLRREPLEGFTRIAKFLGINPDLALIQRAIEHNSLDKMKEKERIAPQRASVKGRFVRAGAVQGWRSKLSAEQLQIIDEYAGAALERLAYPAWGKNVEMESRFESADSQSLAR
jgi:hypothetical protein